MKALTLCLAILALAGAIQTAEGQNWVWAKQAGGSVDQDYGTAVAVDAAGSSYVTGVYTYPATVGPNLLPDNGGRNCFVAKLDPAGNWLWSTYCGGDWDDRGLDIAVDAAGNCYITGLKSTNATFGGIALPSLGGLDIFVAKLDTDGNWLWANHAGGTGNDQANGISLDSAGNTYVTGKFTGTAAFGTQSLTSYGVEDIFIAKLDSSGNWLWARQAGGTGTEWGNEIAADSVGNSTVVGRFYSDPALFGTTSLNQNGVYDSFISRLDTDGNWLWTVRPNSDAFDEITAVALDSDGNAYVTGNFRLTIHFGVIDIYSSIWNLFIAKLSAGGTWLWAKKAESGYSLGGVDIAVDSAGTCYAACSFYDAITIGPFSFTGYGYPDFAIVALGSNGNWLWANYAGSTSSDSCGGITAGAPGECWQAGAFRGTCHFGDISIVSSGNTDIFIAKMGIPAGTGIPVPPENLSIATDGVDILLDWDDVTEDLAGNPVSVDHYLVYYCATGPEGFFTVFGTDGSIVVSEWTHEGAASLSPGFYYVTAVSAD